MALLFSIGHYNSASAQAPVVNVEDFVPSAESDEGEAVTQESFAPAKPMLDDEGNPFVDDPLTGRASEDKRCLSSECDAACGCDDEPCRCDAPGDHCASGQRKSACGLLGGTKSCFHSGHNKSHGSAGCNTCNPCGKAGCPHCWDGYWENSWAPVHLCTGDNYLGLRGGGWANFGVTTNAEVPTNPPDGVGNLPVYPNFRNDDLMLNQVYAFVERPIALGCGCDWGGRLDVLYGEDYLFTQSAGFEQFADGTNRWNEPFGSGENGLGGSTRIGLAVAQAYGEAVAGCFSVKAGKFYSNTDYESVMALSNFFYTHSYSFTYGNPFTFSGILGTCHSHGPNFTVSIGAVNGWDKFDTVQDRASILGGFTLRCPSTGTSFRGTIISGDEDGRTGFFEGNRTKYNIVAMQNICQRWQLVVNHFWAKQEIPRDHDDEWYGAGAYLFFKHGPKWQFGARYEWFNDQTGSQVMPTVASFVPALSVPRMAGQFQAVSAGVNWRPCRNVIIRPEVRWDWFDPHAASPLPSDDDGPYVNFTNRGQFLAAFDMLLVF